MYLQYNWKSALVWGEWHMKKGQGCLSEILKEPIRCTKILLCGHSLNFFPPKEVHVPILIQDIISPLLVKHPKYKAVPLTTNPAVDLFWLNT